MGRKEILECAHHLKCTLPSADPWTAFWLFIAVGLISSLRNRSLRRPKLRRTGTFQWHINFGCSLVSAVFHRLDSGSALTIPCKISVVYGPQHEGEHHPTPRVALSCCSRPGTMSVYPSCKNLSRQIQYVTIFSRSPENSCEKTLWYLPFSLAVSTLLVQVILTLRLRTHFFSPTTPSSFLRTPQQGLRCDDEKHLDYCLFRGHDCFPTCGRGVYDNSHSKAGR